MYEFEISLATSFFNTITNKIELDELNKFYNDSKLNYDKEIFNTIIVSIFHQNGLEYDKSKIDMALNKTLNRFNNIESFSDIKDNILNISNGLIFNEKINLENYNIKLHLVRHGKYTPTKVGGWTDDNLSEEGINEINKLSKEIDDYYDIFISSDLNRAKDSSNIINKKLNMNILYDSNFREIDMGIFNLMSIEEFKKNYDSSSFIKMKNDECFLNGESYNLFYERIKKAFINLLNKYNNKKILIVTHGGVITVILSLIYGYPYNFNLQIGPETGSIIRF